MKTTKQPKNGLTKSRLVLSDIPRTEWVAFCEQFSSQHEEQRITLELLDRQLVESELDDDDLEPRTYAEDVPLHAVIADVEGHLIDVSLILDESPRRVIHLGHEVKAIQVERTPSGTTTGLHVTLENGQTFRLRFLGGAGQAALDGAA